MSYMLPLCPWALKAKQNGHYQKCLFSSRPFVSPPFPFSFSCFIFLLSCSMQPLSIYTLYNCPRVPTVCMQPKVTKPWRFHYQPRSLFYFHDSGRDCMIYFRWRLCFFFVKVVEWYFKVEINSNYGGIKINNKTLKCC